MFNKPSDKHFSFTLLLFLCAALAGCFGKNDNGSGYWTRGCILSDGSMMAAVGSDAALIDLNSGKTVRKIAGFYNDVVCLSDNRIFALTSKEAIELQTQKRIDRSTSWTVVGPVYGNQILVSFRTLSGSRTIQSWSGPLKLSVESFDPSKPPAEIHLTTDHFPMLGSGRENFLEVIPVRVLKDNRLLVAAGFSSTDRESEKPWRLFTIDLSNGATVPFGEQRTGDDDLSMFVKLSRLAATPDGVLVAGSSGKTVVFMNSERPNVIARSKLENVREIQQLRFNEEGTMLVAAVIDSNGKQGRIHVFDGRTGKQLWQTEYQNGVIYFVDFLRDDSIVVMRSNQIVSRLDGKDGRILY